MLYCLSPSAALESGAGARISVISSSSSGISRLSFKISDHFRS